MANTRGCSPTGRKQPVMVSNMSTHNGLLKDYTRALDDCRTDSDLYRLSLQFFLKLGFSKIAVCTPDAVQDGKLAVRLSRGFPAAANHVLKAGEAGKVAAFDAYARHERIRIPRFSAQQDYARTDLERDAGVAAAVYLPLTAGCPAQPAGLLIAGSEQETRFSQDLLETAAAMAQLLADHLTRQPREREQASVREDARSTADRYRELYERAPVCHFILRTDGTMSDINAAGRALFAGDNEQRIDFYSYLSAAHRTVLTQWLASRNNSGAALELIITVRQRRVPVLFSAGPHDDARGLTQYYHCSLVDIGDHKQAEIELREKNAQLQINQQIMASVSELLSFVDTEYIYRSVNPAYCRYHATEQDNIIGRSVAEVNGEETFRTLIKPQIDKALQGEKSAYEAWFEYPRMGRRYTMVEYTPCCDNQGNPLGVAVLVKDITERKQAEEALSRAEELQRTLLNSTPDIICFKDGRGRWLLANQADLQLFQLDGVDYQGKTDAELAPYSPFHAEAFLTCAATDEKAWESRELSVVEEAVPMPTGENQIYEVIKHPLFNPDGSRKALVVIGRRITERKKAEQQSHASEAKFRTLIDRLEHIPIQGVDEDRTVVYWNTASTAVYGYSRQEALGRKLEDLILPQHLRGDILEAVRNWLENGVPMPSGEMTLRDKTGNDVPVFTSHVMHIPTAGRREIFNIDIDLRMLYKTEERLRRLAAAVEQTGETIVITDPDADIVYVNPAFTAVTGYSREEAMGQNPRILQSGEVNESVYADMWRTLLAKKTWKGRFINKRKDGGLFTEDVNITPILNSAGEIVNYVAAKRDITEQLSTEEQYRQSQKLEAVGQLAGGIAHDFNNMLAVIIGQTDIALRKIEPEDPLAQRLQDIRKAAQRSSELTQQLLGFARKQPSRPRTLKINETIGETLKMLQRLVGEHIELSYQSAAEQFLVKIDPSHLDQILTNLVINARDAIKDTGVISVSTARKTMNAAFCLRHPGSHPGEYVRLTVRDNGCGMTPEIQKRIFDPFFTTKQSGQGTGLGLAMVFGLVKQNKGYITVASVDRLGTTFQLYFPLEHAAENSLSGDDENEILPGTETVLVVEDEADLLEITTSMLQVAGYTALAAQDSHAAVDIAQGHAGPIHLLLSDMIMPGKTGRELGESLKRIRPDMKTLYMSGYPKETHVQADPQFSNEQLLMKPFSIHKLTRKVREVLAG